MKNKLIETQLFRLHKKIARVCSWHSIDAQQFLSLSRNQQKQLMRTTPRLINGRFILSGSGPTATVQFRRDRKNVRRGAK